MPTINFKGKGAVWNHHLSVPYQVLEKDNKLSIEGKNDNENLIIEGDNLVALKSLLPKYQGKIKCIYIDPPYNIGKNDSWVYSDNVNSPLIKSWIGKNVGIDDLTRHDKWLCMMTPRLKLLWELLDDHEGVIFISINEAEIHHLKQLMDQSFGEDKFVAITTIQSPSYVETTDSIKMNEFILIYKKSATHNLFGEVKTTEGRGTVGNTAQTMPTIEFPAGLKVVGVKDGVYSSIRKIGGNEDIELVGNKITIQDGKLLKSIKLKARWRNPGDLKKFFNNNCTPIVNKFKKKIVEVYLKGDRFMPYTVKESGEKFPSLITTANVPNINKKGSDELRELFGEKIFNYPKNTTLVKYILSFFDDTITVLDSFAGSGTTAQSVLDLNRENGGNRKFILIQLPEKIEKDTPAYKTGFGYIHEITRERVKRVIQHDKIDIGFSYFKLGAPIDAESILSGKLPTYKEFAKYVYYLATGETIDNEKSIDESRYFVGKDRGESIYLIYQKDKDKLKNMAVTLDWAEKISKKDKGKKIVYAPACFLDEEHLEKFNIQFVGVPYNLFEKK